MKYFLFTILSIFSGTAFSQWANYQGTAGSSSWGNASAVSDSGYVYTTGMIQGSDIFVSKITPGGELKWRKHIYCDYSEGFGVVTDASERVYVAGGYNGTMFDTLPLNTPNGSNDIFIACFEPDGKLAWVRTAGGFTNDYATAIAKDQESNLYITGYYGGSSIVFGDTVFNGTGMFVAKYDSTGNFKWVRPYNGAYSQAMTVDREGNILLTGGFADEITIGNYTLDASGDIDVFTVKFDPDGNVLWAKSAGGASTVLGGELTTGIATDYFGNSYITGWFTNSASFDGVVVTGSGDKDIFIAKYDVDGNIQWVKKGGGTGEDQPFAITASANGDSYITGRVSDVAVFDSVNIPKGMFMFRYDPDGNMVSHIHNNSDGFDGASGKGICLDKYNDCYVTGWFEGIANFAQMQGYSDAPGIFVWKMGSVLNTEPIAGNEYFGIYPNPMSDIATVDLGNTEATGLIITNLSGKMIRQINHISGAEVKIERDEMESGIYLVQLVKGQQIVGVQKLVVGD